MTTSMVLLLIVAVFTAFALSFYQYIFKAKKKSKALFFLAFLRFCSYLAIFILLINPIITHKDFEVEKTPLPVLVDNSASIKELGQDSLVNSFYKEIVEDKALNDKFDVQLFTFDEDFNLGEKPNYQGKQTQIAQAAQNLKQLYRGKDYPVLLISDGNQTLGNDYIYSFTENTEVYPIVVGDTTLYPDLKVNQVNVNKYALLKNKFPVEVFLQYSGNKNIDAEFSIKQGNTVVHKQIVSFTENNKAQVVNVLLEAKKVGVQTYKAVITSAEQEKNTYNNTKNFAVEVIHQRSEVAIVSAITHPDLGALKRSIENNKQRNVTLLKPSELKSLQDYNVLILYQPDATFRNLLEQNKTAELNTFVITGLHTDFNLLNRYQDLLSFKMTSQKENYTAQYNSLFNLFAVDDIGFEQFPPLQNPFGTVTVKSSANELLGSSIRNLDTDSPLFIFSENGVSRNALLLGEDIWKWRMEAYLKSNSFEQFDVFIDKTVQFLASNSKRKALIVNHENFYNSGELIDITAQFFNKNYEFDENARLTIRVKNSTTGESKTYDFLKGNNEYKVNLDGITAGKYSFTVKENNSNTIYNSSFQVLDFDIEKQFVNPDLKRLQQTALKTGGEVYYSNNTKSLLNKLISNNSYKATQKEINKKSPLIDWVWLLLILAITLATEWFTRKYNGLM